MKIPNSVYKNLFDYSEDIVIITDADFNILDSSENTYQVFGRIPSELDHYNLVSYLPLDMVEKIKNSISANQKPPDKFMESSLTLNDKHLIPILYKCSLFETGEGRFFHFRFRDISQVKQIRDELTDIEAHFRILFEQNIVGVAEIDKRGLFLRINEKYGNILGFSKKEMLALNYKTITHPDDLAKSIETAKQVMDGKCDEVTYEKRYMTKSDKFIWVSVTIRASQVVGMKQPRYFAIIKDITDLKQLQEELKICRDRLKVSQAFGHVANWEHYLEEEMVWTTEEGFRIFGYTHPAGEISVQLISSLIVDWENVQKEMLKSLSEKGEYHIEQKINPADGSSQRTIISACKLINDEKGAPLKLSGIIHDVTDRRIMQTELFDEKKKNLILADLISRSAQPMVVAYQDGTVGVHNQALLDLLGYDESDIAALNYLSPSFTSPKWQELRENKLEELRRTKKPIRYELEYIRKDGSLVPVELLVDAATDEQGDVKYYYAFITDISQRKAEQQILADHVANFYRMFEQIDIGAAFLQCIRNENGEAVNYRIVHFNKAYVDTMGFNPSDLPEPSTTQLDVGKDQMCWEYYKQVFDTRVLARFETPALIPGRIFLVRAYPQEPEILITFIKDVTDEKNLH